MAVMDGGKCIFMLRGVRPFLSDKYDLTRHPNYRYTADADPKNVFDMERYMKKQRAVEANELAVGRKMKHLRKPLQISAM